MKIYSLFLMFFWNFQLFSLDAYTYGKAISAVKSGKFDDAQAHLLRMIVDSPDRPDLIYDMGVVSYKKNDFKSAQTYFHRASEYASDKKLKEQAFFNYANASVAQNELRSAIEGYEKVLRLNKDNTHAQHNLDVVKRMLQEQEKKKDEQTDNSQEKQDPQDNQKEDQNNEQKNNQSDNEQQNEKKSPDSSSASQNDQKGKQQNKSNDQSPRSQKRNEKGDTDSKVDGQDSSNSGHKGDNRKDSKEVHNNTSDQKRDNKIDHSADSPSSDTSKPTTDKKEATQQQQHNSSDKESNPTGFMGNADKRSLPTSEQWMSTLLDSQEHADKNANKQFVRLLTRSQSAGETPHDKSW